MIQMLLLQGEMKRISDEQKRIEELQSVMNSSPARKSTPHKENPCPEPDDKPQRDLSVIPNLSSSDHIPANSTVISSTDGIQPSDLKLDYGSFTDSTLEANNNGSTIPPASSMTESFTMPIADFSQPATIMSQSSDEPFILHQSPKQKSDQKSKANSSKPTPRRSGATFTSPDKPAEKSTKKSTNHTAARKSTVSTPTGSNGFLSSSQLSNRKVSFSLFIYS